MTKEFITLGGTKYRVEANWNATVAFLKFKGTDDIAAFTDIANLKPSDLAPLFAACVNEGERLEGHEVSFTPEEVGAVATMPEMSEFLRIFVAQIAPAVAPDKKKD